MDERAPVTERRPDSERTPENRPDRDPRDPSSAGSKDAPPSGTRTAHVDAQERWQRTKANTKTIGGAILLAVLIRIVLFEAFEIDGPSMEPTLLNGDRVVVAKFPFGFIPCLHRRWLCLSEEAVVSWGMPDPGDVIILISPYDDVDIVKRVIGVPGDTIEVRDDEVWRNGEPIRQRVVGPCEESESSEDPTDCEWIEEGIGALRWRTSHSLLSMPESMSPVVVPEGHVFVLGDHRDRSNDSRNPRVGMIPIERVKGRALAIYWSRDARIRWDRVMSAVR